MTKYKTQDFSRLLNPNLAANIFASKITRSILVSLTSVRHLFLKCYECHQQCCHFCMLS